MNKQNPSSCPLYPCFDTLTGATFKTTSGRVTFTCNACPYAHKIRTKTPRNAPHIETLYFHKMRIHNPKSSPCHDPAKIINTLENTKGICKDSILILTHYQKKQALEIEKSDNHQNIGVYSALARDLTILCAHDKDLRPPPMPTVLLVKHRKIIGEMTSTGKQFYTDKSTCEYVLPPIDFPELNPFGKDVVSSSPGLMLDAWLRKKISINPTDATLILGLNRKR